MPTTGRGNGYRVFPHHQRTRDDEAGAIAIHARAGRLAHSDPVLRGGHSHDAANNRFGRSQQPQDSSLGPFTATLLLSDAGTLLVTPILSIGGLANAAELFTDSHLQSPRGLSAVVAT